MYTAIFSFEKPHDAKRFFDSIPDDFKHLAYMAKDGYRVIFRPISSQDARALRPSQSDVMMILLDVSVAPR